MGLFTAVMPALAYPLPVANVNFVSERGVPFDLVLDGRLLTRGGARQVHVDRLLPGQHWADFTLPAGYGRVVQFRSRVWLQPGLETSFVLIARPGRPLDLRQIGAVSLYGPAYGGGNGYYNGPGNGAYNSPMPYGQGGNNNGYPPNNASPNGSYDNDPNEPAGSYGNGNNGPGGYGNNPGPNGGYYPGSATSNLRPLSYQDVDYLLQNLRQQPGDAAKLNTAQNALERSSLQSDDLLRLLRSLSNEAARISLATFAYPHVADRENFSRVYDAFTSESSVRVVQQSVGSTSPNQY